MRKKYIMVRNDMLEERGVENGSRTALNCKMLELRLSF